MSAAVSTSGQTSRRVGWTEGRSCSDDAAAMPLSLERIEELRDDCFAGDIDFDYDELKEWTRHGHAWFENAQRPAACRPRGQPPKRIIRRFGRLGRR